MITIDFFAQAAQLVNQNQWSEAAKLIDLGLASTPKHPGLQMLKGLELMIGKRYADSETFFRRALAAEPHNPEFHNNYGVLLQQMERLDDAHAEFVRAVELNPRYKEGQKNLGFTSWRMGDYDLARVSFSNVVALSPNDAMAPFHLSELLLGHGELKDGWRIYQWRPNRAIKAREFGVQPLTYPVAPLPRRLDGKQIVLLPEQGFGDILFFLRYAPLLKARGARVGYGAEKKIRRFIQDCGVLDDIFDEQTIRPHLKSPWTFFAGDLPFLSAEDDSTPPSVRIQPLPDRVAAARKRLAELGPPPYVGVNWRAGNPPAAGENLLFKKMSPGRLGSALRGINATFLALQRLPQPGEVDEFREALGKDVHDLTSIQGDLEELMGFLAVIDEIVGVSSTSIHLRAAMGLDARVLFVTPTEWRWMLEGEESPWFPGCRVYRAHRPSLVDPSLERLHKELAESFRSRGYPA